MFRRRTPPHVPSVNDGDEYLRVLKEMRDALNATNENLKSFIAEQRAMNAKNEARFKTITAELAGMEARLYRVERAMAQIARDIGENWW